VTCKKIPLLNPEINYLMACPAGDFVAATRKVWLKSYFIRTLKWNVYEYIRTIHQ